MTSVDTLTIYKITKLYEYIIKFERRLYNKLKQDQLTDKEKTDLNQRINIIKNDYGDLHDKELYGDN